MTVVDNVVLRQRIAASRIIAILRGTDVDATVAAARTLLTAGLRTLEIALTLDDAEEAIAQVAHDAPAGALIGAGTVLTEADVDRAVAAGAQFMVTPTLADSVPYAVREGIGVLPGVYTPTEIQRGLDLGAAAVKLFPASALGPGFIRAVREPFPQARIIPVGVCGSTRSVTSSHPERSASVSVARWSATPRREGATSALSPRARGRSSMPLRSPSRFHRSFIGRPSGLHNVAA